MRLFWKIGCTAHDKDKKAQSLVSVEPDEAKIWLAAGDTLLIDIREVEEYAREAIAGAISMPLSTYPLQLEAGSSIRRVVFHCQSGSRTRLAACRLRASTSLPAFQLTGGLHAWKRT
jgi:rhodanese-related sulfurtransferase